MITENLSTLKIHKLTKEQYERELAAGRIDENALYLTPDEAVDLSQYVTNDDLEAKGYLTSNTESDPTVPAWAKEPSKPTYTASEVGALPDTTVIPTVPTNVSAFTNDAGYLTEHQDISGKLDASKLPEAVNEALAQAKASGEFDGAPGPTYILTDADKATIVSSVVASLPMYNGEVVDV